MVFVAVGDVSHDELSNLLKESFGDWKTSPLSDKKEEKRGSRSGGKTYVTMEDKTSTDFLVGIPVGITRDHPD